MFALPNDAQPDEMPSQDDEAFIVLITRSQRPILAFLMALVPNLSDAEDILQRTNLVIWRKRSLFQPGTNFKAWAFSIARWEALAFRKESRREDWLIYNEELASIISERMANIPDTSINSMSDSLRHCLGQLSTHHRQLITERYSRGLSLREISERYDRSESGLKVTLHRLRISLRRCVSKYTPPQAKS
jgi:RNA polymerase sigma-70 factor, ECF subfamily